MHKFQQESKQAGKSSFAYAWVLDAHDEERSRGFCFIFSCLVLIFSSVSTQRTSLNSGITVDVAVNYFETPHRQITLLDAPGHKDFIPNMISGAAQADVAILVVDATPGGFDDGFTDGGQTKEHAVLIRSLGVSELVIAVNKMDSVGWSRDRFQAVQAQMTPFLLATGFKEKNITYCPVSGFTGDNLHLAPENAAAVWCGVDGVPTLLQCIDRFSPPERLLDRPLRMCVADVYRSQSLGVTVGGKIESGSVLVGEKVLLLPLGEVATVKALNVSTSVRIILSKVSAFFLVFTIIIS
jgi:elongation factor 1 alpha-like protein